MQSVVFCYDSPSGLIQKDRMGAITTQYLLLRSLVLCWPVGFLVATWHAERVFCCDLWLHPRTSHCLFNNKRESFHVDEPPLFIMNLLQCNLRWYHHWETHPGEISHLNENHNEVMKAKCWGRLLKGSTPKRHTHSTWTVRHCDQFL